MKYEVGFKDSELCNELPKFADWFQFGEYGIVEIDSETGGCRLIPHPKSKEAQQAVAMLQAFKDLPKPLRMGPPTGPLRLPSGGANRTRAKTGALPAF